MNNEIIQFYNRVLCTVRQVTGQKDFLHTNREEAVDARTILILLLSEKGLSDKEISIITGLTRQGVNKLKNSARFRIKKWSFHSDLQQIRNELATDNFSSNAL